MPGYGAWALAAEQVSVGCAHPTRADCSSPVASIAKITTSSAVSGSEQRPWVKRPQVYGIRKPAYIGKMTQRRRLCFVFAGKTIAYEGNIPKGRDNRRDVNDVLLRTGENNRDLG